MAANLLHSTLLCRPRYEMGIEPRLFLLLKLTAQMQLICVKLRVFEHLFIIFLAVNFQVKIFL